MVFMRGFEKKLKKVFHSEPPNKKMPCNSQGIARHKNRQKKKAYHLFGMIRLQNSNYLIVLQSAVKSLKTLDITGFLLSSCCL